MLITNSKPQVIVLFIVLCLAITTFAQQPEKTVADYRVGRRKQLSRYGSYWRIEPNNIFGNHALGQAYAETGDKTGAMQQYYILQNLNPRLAAGLLKAIPK